MANGEIVSQFLLDICRTRRVNTAAVSALIEQCVRLIDRRSDDDKVYYTSLTTGSVAELYISPMWPCVGDTDIMYHTSEMLAVPPRWSPPSQLPAEFGRRVKVFEIIDSELPGYVFLESAYILKQCSEHGRYNAVECERGRVGYNLGSRDDIHGPARLILLPNCLLSIAQVDSDWNHPVDLVICMRCLSWPPQAADWPTRHRKYNWPDSATVDRVVSDGCDVVPIAHPLCRQDDYMTKKQWRLSFSRAEIVLLNSWMREQQILYHMLRLFVKTEIKVNNDDSAANILCNYHIKTVMLWACELKPRNFWSDDFNVVEICVYLMHVLGVWLRDARCKHYFVKNCNLLDRLGKSCSDQMSVVNKLLSASEESLSKWFVDNYIPKCASLFGDDGSKLYDVTNKTRGLKKAATMLVKWRRRQPIEDYCCFSATQSKIVMLVTSISLTVRSTSFLMSHLSKLDYRLSVYFIAVAFLHVAYKTTRDSLSDELLDVLATIRQLASQMSVTDDVQKHFYESVKHFIGEVLGVKSVRRAENVKYERRLGVDGHRARLATSRSRQLDASELVELLQQSAVEHLTTSRQLEMEDIYSAPDVLVDEIGIVTTDIEALYAYKCGEYQRCLQLSTDNVRQVIKAHMPKVGAYTLPEFIQLMDDDIVSLLGLTLLINPSWRITVLHVSISQLSLSLYLMSQCQMKLGHPVTSLHQTLDCVKFVFRKHRRMFTVDHALLKLVEKKVKMYIESTTSPRSNSCKLS